MRIKDIKLKEFKRFTDLTIENIPQKTKLVILTGPNGSGKSSLFEAFNCWMKKNNGRNSRPFDNLYHPKISSMDANSFYNDGLKIGFHEASQFNREKCFYIRSAYRHEADFTTNGISNQTNILHSIDRLPSLIHREERISENYNRIVGETVKEIYNNLEPEKTKIAIKDEIIGEVRKVMLKLFDDNLLLSNVGDPLNAGTFKFDKGISSDFHFKNLSGGEKAAFDLLLDFVVKKKAFNDTIFCIDEPELHMHTKLQGRLLEELFLLVPENCQLWISTHSIGMARKADELNKKYEGEVAFIDFHDKDFDKSVILEPTMPNRIFWEKMFETALDDLAHLIAPKKIVFCEGKRLGDSGRKPSFDVGIYTKIFEDKYPDVRFIPWGGTNELQKDVSQWKEALSVIAKGTEVSAIFDRDDRSEQDILKLKSRNINVLKKRDLENYLWDDEILKKLESLHKPSENLDLLINKKKELIENNKANGKPCDDIKYISSQLYIFCKKQLGLTQCGNDTEAFARDTLVPLITSDTEIYKELEMIIFNNI